MFNVTRRRLPWQMVVAATAGILAVASLGGPIRAEATSSEWEQPELWEYLERLERMGPEDLRMELASWKDWSDQEAADFLAEILALPAAERNEFASRFMDVVGQVMKIEDEVGSEGSSPTPLAAAPMASTQTIPSFHIGIEPVSNYRNFNYFADGTNTKTQRCFTMMGVQECVDNRGLKLSASGPLLEGRAYSKSDTDLFGQAFLYLMADLIAQGYSVLVALIAVVDAYLAEIGAGPPHMSDAWAAAGLRYDLVQGCAEQSAVKGKVEITGHVRGWLHATRTFETAAWAKAVVHGVHTDSSQPIGTPGYIEMERELLLDPGNSDWWGSSKNVHINDHMSSATGNSLSPGRHTAFFILGTNSGAFGGVLLGVAEAFSDFYTEPASGPARGLHPDSFHLEWIDTSPPATTASVSGTQGREGWFRSPVTVTLVAQDPQSCVLAIEHEITSGAMKRVDVDRWTPETTFSIVGDGLHERQFRSTNYKGQAETMQTVNVKIDKTVPFGEITRPRQGYCYAQDVEVPTLGALTCATGTSIRLEADATDPVIRGAASGVHQVSFYWGEELVGATGTAPYVVDWDIFLRSGQRPLSICVEDVAGNVACEAGPDLRLA